MGSDGLMSDGWTIGKATGASTFNNSSSIGYGTKSMNAFKTHFFTVVVVFFSILFVPLLFLWVAISLTTTQWTDYKHKNIYICNVRMYLSLWKISPECIKYISQFLCMACINSFDFKTFISSFNVPYVCVSVCKCVRDFISRSSWFVGIPIHLHARSKCNFYFCFTPFHSNSFFPIFLYCCFFSLFTLPRLSLTLARPFVGPFAVDYLLLQTKKCNKKANAKKYQRTRNREKSKLHIHIRPWYTRNSCVQNETWKVVADDNFLSPYMTKGMLR